MSTASLDQLLVGPKFTLSLDLSPLYYAAMGQGKSIGIVWKRPEKGCSRATKVKEVLFTGATREERKAEIEKVMQEYGIPIKSLLI